MPNYDVIVIGGGFLGVSTTYHLARMGVRTLLLDAGDIGSGTSGACSGRAQVCEGHLDPLNILLIREGLKRHETLEEELGASYDWRRVGILLTIRHQEIWDRWLERSAILTQQGIPTEVVDQKSLQEAEPRMDVSELLGAAYSLEGMLNPLMFTHAYAGAALRLGAEIRRNSTVLGMQVERSKVVGVKTANRTFSAGIVAVMAGAWEPVLTRMAGVEVPVRHTHAEALVTEPVPSGIFHNVEIADFYETIHGKQRAVAIGVHPEPNGTVHVTEAVFRTGELHRRVSVWGITSIARELVALFPFLARVRVMRGWGRPTSFTPDEQPLIGWVPQLENMYVASSMLETITTVPLVSEWMAMSIQGKTPPVSLEAYSPGRFANGWTWN